MEIDIHKIAGISNIIETMLFSEDSLNMRVWASRLIKSDKCLLKAFLLAYIVYWNNLINFPSGRQ